MVEIAEIVDRESFERWLKALPEDRQREAALYIATRAALRVLPLALADQVFWGENAKLTALPVFWVVSISEVAAAYPASEIAATKFSNAAFAATEAAFAVNGAFAVFGAYNAANAVTNADFTDYAARAASAAAAAATDFDLWPLTRADARCISGENPFEQKPLWPEKENPFVELWDAAKARMPQSGGEAPTDDPSIDSHGNWTFWIDWYEAHLAGTPFPASLLKEIVELHADLWVNHPAELNRRVLEIYEAWKLKQRVAAGDYPYNAKYDPASGKVVSYPVEIVDLSDIVKDIRQALRDFTRRCKQEGGHNKIGEDISAAVSPAIEELRKQLGRHKDTPQKPFEALEARTAEMAERAKDASLAEEPLITSLLQELAKSGDKICVAAPSVQQYQEDLAQSRLKRAKQDLVLKYAAVTAGMWRESKGDLSVAAEFAVLTVLDQNASDKDRARLTYSWNVCRCAQPWLRRKRLRMARRSRLPGQTSPMRCARLEM